MKRQIILLIATMVSVVAQAQESIEQLFLALDARDDKTLLSKSHYEDDSDKPTTFCRYDEIKMAKTAFGNLGEEFSKTFTNEKEAYKIYKFTLSEPANSTFRVPYGLQNEFSVTFGSHSDHNYLVALFRDKAKSQKRHAYALVWYVKGDNVIIMRYHIYGDDPAKVEHEHVITYDGKQIFDNKGYALSRLGNIEPAINDDLDFMKRFGTLRSSFISTHASSTLVLSGIVVKIVELCKKHGKLLTDTERDTCDRCLQDLKDNHSHGDVFITGMLEEARMALKK